MKNWLRDELRELTLVAYLMPVMLAGAGVCVHFQPPIWLGAGAVFLVCFGWFFFVVRYLPPFRDHPPPWRE